MKEDLITKYQKPCQVNIREKKSNIQMSQFFLPILTQAKKRNVLNITSLYRIYLLFRIDASENVLAYK